MITILDKKRTVLALYREWSGDVAPAIGDKIMFPALVTEKGTTTTKILVARVVDRMLKIASDEQFQEAGIEAGELTVELL